MNKQSLSYLTRKTLSHLNESPYLFYTHMRAPADCPIFPTFGWVISYGQMWSAPNPGTGLTGGFGGYALHL